MKSFQLLAVRLTLVFWVLLTVVLCLDVKEEATGE